MDVIAPYVIFFVVSFVAITLYPSWFWPGWIRWALPYFKPGGRQSFPRLAVASLAASFLAYLPGFCGLPVLALQFDIGITIPTPLVVTPYGQLVWLVHCILWNRALNFLVPAICPSRIYENLFVEALTKLKLTKNAHVYQKKFTSVIISNRDGTRAKDFRTHLRALENIIGTRIISVKDLNVRQVEFSLAEREDEGLLLPIGNGFLSIPRAKSYVYLLKAGHKVKIGHSKNPSEVLKDAQRFEPGYEIIFVAEQKGSITEKALHREFEEFKIRDDAAAGREVFNYDASMEKYIDSQINMLQGKEVAQ